MKRLLIFGLQALFIGLAFLDNDDGAQLAILPAAIVGAGSVLGSVLGGLFGSSSNERTNEMNLQIARENNQFNAQQAQLSRDWQENMWNKQNEYNDPKNQVARAIAAGINPYIDEGSSGQIMSQGAAGSAGSGAAATAAAAPSMVAPDMSWIGNTVGSAVQSGAQVLSALQGQQESQARTADILSQIGYREKDYQLRKSADQIARDMLELNREQMGYQNELLRWQSAESASKIATEEWNRRLIDSNIRINDVQAKSIQNDLDYFVENLALRWFDAKTNRISASAAVRQVAVMADRLAFEKDQYGNFNIPGLDDAQRNRLKQESFDYMLNSLMSGSASSLNDRRFEEGYFRDMNFINYMQRAVGGTMRKIGHRWLGQ